MTESNIRKYLEMWKNETYQYLKNIKKTILNLGEIEILGFTLSKCEQKS